MVHASAENATWERMIRAEEKVRERLLRVTAALDEAGIPYAAVGGNAIASWVARLDESAVRNTADVDLILRRQDLPAARTALEAKGFLYRHIASINRFLDGPEARARDAVHIVFAGEKVRSNYPLPVPDVSESKQTSTFKVLGHEPLVRMKLTSYRLKDRVHILDLIGVGLIDATWLEILPEELRPRLKKLLDNPNA